MLSKQALQEILELLSDSEGNFIILEKDLPKFVILDFNLYKNIINKSKAAAESLLQSADDAVRTAQSENLAAYAVTRQKILITAGAKSITKSVVDKFSQAGHEVVLIAPSFLDGVSEKVKQVVGDYGNPEVLNEVFSGDKFQTAIHLAENSGAKQSFLNAESYFVENVEKSILFVKAVTKYGVRQFIYRSSIAGSSPYAKTKTMVEDILKFYQASFGLNSIALRLPKIAEAQQISEDVEAEVFENPVNAVMAATAGKISCLPVPNVGDLTSDGSPRLDVISLTDAVSAFEFSLKLITEGSGSVVYKVDPISLTLNQLIEAALETSQKMVATNRMEAGELWEQLPDDSKALSAAGWNREDSEISKIIQDNWQTKEYREPVSLGDLLAGHYTPFIKPHSS